MARSEIELSRLIRGALGEIKADLIIRGGRLVNVYSGEILDGFEIAVIDGRICYLGPSAGHARGDATEVFDASGYYIAPGFVDGHTHIGHYARPFEQLQAFLPHGTTALVASCDELATVFGFRGLEYFLDEVEQHPLRVYTMVSMVAPQDPLLCSTATLGPSDIERALADARVLGMGEIVSWLRLLQCDPLILDSLASAHRNRRIIHGHTAGARDQKLCAVAAAGVSSCHEPIRFEDALERLRLGYWTMLREGSLRQDLAETLPKLARAAVDLRRLILVTDSMTPDDVSELGHMDNVVRRAIALGLSPLQAIQAVTLAPAIYSGLEHDIGGIAPGRHADILLIDDLERCHVSEVLIGGKRVAARGCSEVVHLPAPPPPEFLDALHLKLEINAEVLKIPAPSETPKVRVMELLNQTITAERLIEFKAVCGSVGADLERDLLKVAMFDRHGRSAQAAFGFLKGFGAKVGAVGLTTNLDENTLMIVGSDDHDMALCADTLLGAGGGVAVVHGGTVIEKLELPVGGIFSLLPWQEVGVGLQRVQDCLRAMGSPFEKPIFALSFLPFVTLPALRITARGLIHAKERRIVSLFAD